ncbi:MAG: MBL fold metallo-hydrolase [Magnetococcales bacterium]|nr:MBL fold metallo-hydrolase [Magnetococcales bacterium]MBF0439754.1 MBL fold metallo-hydrolase [Magnetococcales bacterium]
MKLKFWGVRGSIATPGPTTVKYGGNTTCIEIRTDENDLIILDAGTGLFQLALTLFPELPLTCHLFITHTHWDHIQGLPFFIPSFIPGNILKIHGAYDPIARRDIREILSGQLQYCYFPVREAELRSKLEYITLKERQTIEIGSTTVTNILMNHPVLSFGYRIESHGKSIFFTGDHEPLFNIYEPADDEYEEYNQFMIQKNQSILEFIRGVEILIADTSYTLEDYPLKKGWGHSTFDNNIALAKAAGVKKLFFTHHEPTRSDDALERAFHEALERNPRQPGDPEYLLAMEGLVVEL